MIAPIIRRRERQETPMAEQSACLEAVPVTQETTRPKAWKRQGFEVTA